MGTDTFRTFIHVRQRNATEIHEIPLYIDEVNPFTSSERILSPKQLQNRRFQLLLPLSLKTKKSTFPATFAQSEKTEKSTFTATSNVTDAW